MEPVRDTATVVGEYKMYRRINIALNRKIMNACLTRDVVMASARLLSIARGENTLLFETEDETGILMDFALNDYRVDNRNTVEIYNDTIGGKDEIEKELLDAFIASSTSLFKITAISEEENTLFLSDLLTERDVSLLDIGLSTTSDPGFLLFVRLVHLKHFNMTSGVSFAFPGHLETYLLEKYTLLTRNVASDSESVKRFVSFYRLSKTKGIEVSYDVESFR
jgi:hypothetical protein